MVEARLVEVYRAKDDIQAGPIKSALEAGGLSAHVAGDSVGALYPQIWWAGARILVAEADVDRAAAILRDFEHPPQHESGPEDNGDDDTVA